MPKSMLLNFLRSSEGIQELELVLQNQGIAQVLKRLDVDVDGLIDVSRTIVHELLGCSHLF